ncbi:uncharacterized protein LOC143260900 [Megalopta genalis]|uniref:uncharacterized protein LOC143260900 n=1 Tax=Megalopta genalis TaxID=115081 RepID=UPI003FD0E275
MLTYEQRAVIKFHEKLGKNASETFRLTQQVYGTDCSSRANVSPWHKRFSEGGGRVEDDDREGRPTSETRNDRKSARLYRKRSQCFAENDGRGFEHRRRNNPNRSSREFGRNEDLEVSKRSTARISRVRSDYRDPETRVPGIEIRKTNKETTDIKAYEDG